MINNHSLVCIHIITFIVNSLDSKNLDVEFDLRHGKGNVLVKNKHIHVCKSI